MSLEKPRFRRDLEATAVEADGQNYVEVNDRRAGTSFRFYDFEYGVALAFDGLAFDKVVPWVKLSSGLELTVLQLKEFAARLDEMGFLETDTGFTPTPRMVPRMLDPAEAETTSNAALDRELVGLVAATSLETVPSGPGRKSDQAVRSGFGPDARSSEAPDSTSGPASPAPPPAQTMEPDAPTSTFPPAWTTPRPMMTPVPVTFGPSLLAEQPSPAVRRRRRRSFVLFAALGIISAVAVLLVTLPFLFPPLAPSTAEVSTLVAAPGTIFRYFDEAGVIEPIPGLVLKFPAPGKVTRIASPGATLAAGDVAAAVEAARPLQTQLAHQIERLAFHQQMTEAMNRVGNTKEEERQAATLDERNAKIAKTLRALASVAVVANDPSQVEETLAHEGDVVQAGSPALRLRSAGFRITFNLPRADSTRARRLGFCHVEVDGYENDCHPVAANSEDTRVSVDVESVPPSLLDKPAHLARIRLSGASVVPAAAILRSGSSDQVLVVSPKGQAEARPVTVAERNAAEAILIQGLDTGDRVIVEAPASLAAGMPIRIR
jgi:hypothetical protein